MPKNTIGYWASAGFNPYRRLWQHRKTYKVWDNEFTESSISYRGMCLGCIEFLLQNHCQVCIFSQDVPFLELVAKMFPYVDFHVFKGDSLTFCREHLLAPINVKYEESRFTLETANRWKDSEYNVNICFCGAESQEFQHAVHKTGVFNMSLLIVDCITIAESFAEGTLCFPLWCEVDSGVFFLWCKRGCGLTQYHRGILQLELGYHHRVVRKQENYDYTMELMILNNIVKEQGPTKCDFDAALFVGWKTCLPSKKDMLYFHLF